MPAQQQFAILDLIPARRDTVSGWVTGNSFDLSGYINPGGRNMKFIASVGTVGTSLDAKVQDSPDNITFTDVTGAAITQATQALATPATVHFRTKNQYVRALANPQGTCVYTAQLLVEKRAV